MCETEASWLDRGFISLQLFLPRQNDSDDNGTMMQSWAIYQDNIISLLQD